MRWTIVVPVTLALAAGGLALAQSPQPSANSSATKTPSAASSGAGAPKEPADDAALRVEGNQISGRWREGSRLIDQTGYFKMSGDRVVFSSTDGKVRFDCLENLASERVGRAIGDSPDHLPWIVTGTITEFRGANYLLISQAVLKSRPAAGRRG